MTNVYIITREGRSFSQEGYDHITRMIRRRGDESELMFHMGAIYNNATYLSSLLKKETHAYIIMSENMRKDTGAGRISLFPPSVFKGVCETLDGFPEDSSWEILYDIVYHEEDEESGQ